MTIAKYLEWKANEEVAELMKSKMKSKLHLKF